MLSPHTTLLRLPFILLSLVVQFVIGPIVLQPQMIELDRSVSPRRSAARAQRSR